MTQFRSKEGRPPRIIESIHALNAWNELCRKYPRLAEIERRVLEGNLTLDQAQTLFDDACADMLSWSPLYPLPSARGTSREQRLLSAAQHFQVASSRLAMARQLKGAADRACSEMEIAAQDYRDELLALALAPPPPEAYAISMAVRLLKAVCLTSAISRQLTDTQFAQFASILKSVPDEDATDPPSPALSTPVSIRWTANNAWVSMPKVIPGYRFTERPLSDFEPNLGVVYSIGLPPSNDLADFGLDGMHAAFKAARTPHAKRRECWSLLSHWLRANRIEGWDKPVTMKIREQTWVFMFAVQYGFTAGLSEFRTARFPSPWQEDAVICAERV